MLDALGLAPGLRTFIGIAELLGALGFLLPGLTRVLPWLTPLAAAGLGSLPGRYPFSPVVGRGSLRGWPGRPDGGGGLRRLREMEGSPPWGADSSLKQDLQGG